MICRLVQYNLSSLDDNEPWAFASGHLAGCSRCQEFSEGLARLDQGLRSSRSTAPAPHFKPATITDPRTALPAFAALACAIAVVVLLVKLPSQEPKKTKQPMLAHASTTAPSQPMPSPETEPPPAEDTSPWDMPGLRHIASQAPMEEELAALRQDGKRGIDAILSIGRRK